MSIKKMIIAVALMAVGLSGQGAYASDDRFTIAKEPKLLPQFSLLDEQGKSFTHDQLKDRWSLMFLGFTSCPDICPVIMMKLGALQNKLASCNATPAAPEVILLAVDPERDQSNLKEGYLDSFKATSTGITGNWEEIDILVDGLGAAYKFGKNHDGAHAAHHGYDVVHTTAVYVINPQGKLVATMGMPLNVASASVFIANLMSNGDANPTLNACLSKSTDVASLD